MAIQVGRLTGWRRALLAFALGAIAVLAMPPLYVLPALVPAFVGLIWLIDGARHWRAALLTGFWFGLGHFTCGLYWVANALLTKPEQFGWIAPVAPVGLALLLTPNTAVAAAVTRLASRPGVGRVLVLASAWTIMEWVRSWALTGFPWNLIGSVWAFSEAMLQPASVIGTYGLGLATVAAAAMPSVLAYPSPDLWTRWRPIAVSATVLCVFFVFGVIRLAAFGTVGTVDGVHLRLVQGDIPQNQKWRRDLVDAHLLAQAQLGAAPGNPAPTHVIWSEAAAPLLLSRDPQRLSLVGSYTPPGGLTILGSLRTTADGIEPFQVWNSLLAIDEHGRIVGSYDKSHLVPFGEYMPLRSVLGLDSVAGGTMDLSRGDGVHTLHLPGLPPVGALICYEVIFPGEVTDPQERPKWLLNLTNDGWYGRSAGPYQHLVAARLRAVEEGLPVVRVANTGISAIIDPLGRIVASLGLQKRGVVDGMLPLPLDRPTIFAETGVWGGLGLAAAVGMIGMLVFRRK
ncbi:MAG: apolipoprotein N-acyltransferase [Rhodospirillales bacterium]|nr:apolipoprotein N-acyltransferase [Rhodospirillales bacterium]